MKYHPGIYAVLSAALLFGAGTPLAKLLLVNVNPWLLAGLLYLGSGIGLTLYRFLNHSPPVNLPYGETLWFAGAILAGGVIAPVLLMVGLRNMPASSASLLLNAESVFTSLLAWCIFKENVDRGIAFGMAVIATGSVVLNWQGEFKYTNLWSALYILGACFAWGVDNNLTRKVSLSDATWITSIKGLVAGSVNLTLALTLGTNFPALLNIAGAMVLGFFAYGVSLALFVVGLRHLGTARAGAYFSTAPFFGAILAVFMGEPITTPLLLGGLLMAFGIWLHLTERHEHEHTHEALIHSHQATDDDHHQDCHDSAIEPGNNTSHEHKEITHTHPHFPDAHHRHNH